MSLDDIQKAGRPPGAGVSSAEVARRYGQSNDEVVRHHPEIVAAIHRVASDFDPVFACGGQDNVTCFRSTGGREMLAVYGKGPESVNRAPSAFVYDPVAKVAGLIQQDLITDKYGRQVPNNRYRVYGNPDPEMRGLFLAAEFHAIND